LGDNEKPKGFLKKPKKPIMIMKMIMIVIVIVIVIMVMRRIFAEQISP